MSSQATAAKGEAHTPSPSRAVAIKLAHNRATSIMPQADPIVRADRVQLVDDNFATEKRERVAKFIVDHWNDQDDLTLTEIAEETGTSRQHVKNVLDYHFESADEQSMNQDRSSGAPALEGIDSELLQKLLTAYRIGVRDGSSEEVEPGISEELLELATRE